MKLSAPIFKLKRQARVLSRQQGLPLHAALDQVAAAEGFQSWSHLASAMSAHTPALRLLDMLTAGDMLLVAARPGHGKTLLALELAALAPRIGRRGHVFTLDFNESDILRAYDDLGIDPKTLPQPVSFDTSDDICVPYILDQLGGAAPYALVVVDYLQLLDQKRSTPDLNTQISMLRAHAKATGAIFALVSQVDRRFDTSDKSIPDISDVRLPNPLDLSAFDQTCFLHDGALQIRAAA